GLDGIALLEHGARVLDALAPELRGAQIAFDVVGELHHRALRLDARHRTLDDRTLAVRRYVGGERIALELLDAERDALALGVDGEDDRLDLVALLVVAHRLFARPAPGEIRQVNQPVDAAFEADEDAEIGDRLDLAADALALVVVRRELLPRVRHALLHAERDAAAFGVDVEDHDLDLVAEMHDLRRVDVLVGPIHLRDVHQTLDAGLDLDERAVVGDVRDLAEQPGALRIAPGDVDPGVVAELLEAERDAVAFAVVAQHLGFDLVADLEHLGRVLYALPGE